MVTFALPGDNDVAEPSNATPRSRPPLPFSQRAVAGSSYGSFKPRAGTPHTRKTLHIRDDIPNSSLNRSVTSTRGNLFRSSTVAQSPTVTPFSPSFSQSPMTKVFAPGATPVPSQIQREVTVQATPRGVAAKAKDKELFHMRIPDPPLELTGEVLAQKVPKDWDPKGSIYADQYLAHLCPSEFDEDQRRQFFCILDLRRLKYAADEIFCKKGWKLNVINFAKEFEKSRSIIMLRYGLYEFQNVKPSKEILKRWRREHGLPDPEEEESVPTPTKPSAKKKRKAADDSSSTPAKRRAPVNEVSEPVAALASTAPPAFAGGQNKRKASVSGETPTTPAKIQKPTSGARSMFEKAANKASSTPSGTPAKANVFATSKNAGVDLRRSVLGNKTEAVPPSSSGSNIFGYLSDKSSARNSGGEADAESDTDSEAEDSPEADESSAKRPAVAASALETSTPSAAGTRESTPGRSLFDRVTKDGEGQPLRAATPIEAPAPPKNQTWNPNSTPIKFAPTTSSTQPSSLFGASTSASAPSVFGPPKSAVPSNIFGALKPATKEPSPIEDADKDGGESDKENDSQSSKTSVAEPKAPAAPSPFDASLFAPKAAATETSKATEPAKPAPISLFGASSTPAQSNLFGSISKATDSAATPAVSIVQPSTLFGSKPSLPAKKPEKPVASEAPKPALIFGASTTAPNKETSAGSVFGSKPAVSNAGSIFGNAISVPASNLFGNAKTTTPPPTAAPLPTFSFGAASTKDIEPNGTSESVSKPLFSVPQTPAPSGNSMVDGSPMKQDDKSPAKPIFGAGNSVTAPPSGFSFGGTSQTAPSTNIFGSASIPSANNGTSGGIFGAGSTISAGSSFDFNFGAGSSASGSAPNSTNNSFTNPFSSGTQAGAGSSMAPSTMFSFGSSSAPTSGGSANYSFGGASSTPAAPSGGIFGSTNGASSSAPSAAPTFGGFGGSSAQPQQTSNVFGSTQNNLNPPMFAPPPSTGTSKSPFPGRKIAPLKRRG